MPTPLILGDLVVDVVLKDIKHVHLSVHPPSGRVRISAPNHMRLETIRAFAISKLGWIRQQQTKHQGQERETKREYLDRESHYVWGRRHLLKLVEHDAPPSVELDHNRLVLHIRPGTPADGRRAVIARWYRDQIRLAAHPLIAKWAVRLGVNVSRFFVQEMKTRWGSCNHLSQTIRLNTELAKKPPECLEYVVVHELVHLLEPSHNRRFLELMDRHMPKWPGYRDELNGLPISHIDWIY